MQISIVFENSPDRKIYLLVDQKMASDKFKLYRAKAISHEIYFTLKVFPIGDPTCSHRNEKLVLSQLKHPNIIGYFPVANHNLKDDIILTEHAANGSISEFIQEKGSFCEDVARTYFHQLVQGLEYLHSKGIAHLDIKPENVLFDKNFVLKLSDFAGSLDIKERQSQINDRYSTGSATKRTLSSYKNFFGADIYSLGVVLFYLVAGKHPFIYEEGSKSSQANYETFCDKNSKFWKKKEKEFGSSKKFSSEFMELFNRLCSRDIRTRMSINDIKESKWYNGRVLEEKDLKAYMQKL